MESGVIIASKACAPINRVESCVTDTLLLIKAVDLLSETNLLACLQHLYGFTQIQ